MVTDQSDFSIFIIIIIIKRFIAIVMDNNVHVHVYLLL